MSNRIFGESGDKIVIEEKIEGPEISVFVFCDGTDIHAWIDWRRWNADEIDRFIRAFDDPYMGARTTLGDKSVRLKDAELVSDSTNYHPFQSGLIVRKYNNQAMICCSGGIITVSKIIDDHGNDIMSSIEIGDRFFTPEDAIEKALNYSAVYDSTGLKD